MTEYCLMCKSPIDDCTCQVYIENGTDLVHYEPYGLRMLLDAVAPERIRK